MIIITNITNDSDSIVVYRDDSFYLEPKNVALYKKNPCTQINDGNDTYYIDNASFDITTCENNISGEDTVCTYVDYDLPNNFENIVLMDWYAPSKLSNLLYKNGIVIEKYNVYGHPTMTKLIYKQGDSYKEKARLTYNNSDQVYDFTYWGTCALVTAANILRISGQTNIDELTAIKLAKQGICGIPIIETNIPKLINEAKSQLKENKFEYEIGKKLPAVEYIKYYVCMKLGGGDSITQKLFLNLNGISANNLPFVNLSFFGGSLNAYNFKDYPEIIQNHFLNILVDKLKQGYAVILGGQDSYLNGNNDPQKYNLNSNHSILLTGVAYNTDKNGNDLDIQGFYICDSGDIKKPADYLCEVKDIINYLCAIDSTATITEKPIKTLSYLNNLSKQNNTLTLVGNNVDNVIVGNSYNKLNVFMVTPLYPTIVWDKESVNNILKGCDGNDIYFTGTGKDLIIDTVGDDKYIIDASDSYGNEKTILDYDKQGFVYVIDVPSRKLINTEATLIKSKVDNDIASNKAYKQLTGAFEKPKGNEYKGQYGEIYIWGEGLTDLTIKYNGVIITIKNFSNGDLNIKFDEKEEPSENVLFGWIEETVMNFIYPTEPLILDLDGNGIITSTPEDGVYLDMHDDGFAELNAWAGEGDGVLALDLNNNGIIDSGKEIFGENMELLAGGMAQNGFEALAQYDSNGDHIIDAQDEIFSRLRVIKNYGEISNEILFTMEEVGVTAINLNYTEVNVTDPNENTRVYDSTITMANGETHQIGAYLLDRYTSATKQREVLDVPEDIAALPEYENTGNLYSLHQAMVRDTSGEIQTLILDPKPLFQSKLALAA